MLMILHQEETGKNLKITFRNIEMPLCRALIEEMDADKISGTPITGVPKKLDDILNRVTDDPVIFNFSQFHIYFTGIDKIPARLKKEG